MSTINLGDDWANAVLQAAGLDPQTHDPASLAVDYLPAEGRTTIRVTRVADVDTAELRGLIADAAEGRSVF